MWRRSLFLLLLGAGVAVDACGNSSFSSSEPDGGSDASIGNDASALADGATSDASNVGDSALPDGSLPAGTIVLISGQDNPHDLIVSKGHLFWTNYSELLSHGSVMTADVNGSNISIVADATHANRIAFDGATLYWSDFVSPDTTNSIIASAPVDGGAATKLDQFTIAPMGIAVDDQFIYTTSLFGFAGAGTVVARDKFTGFIVGNIATGVDNPVSVAAISQGVVWTALGATPSSGQVGFGTVDAGTLTIAAGLSGPWGITATPNVAYATALTTPDASTIGSIVAYGYDSGAETSTNSTGVRPYFIASDANKIYWTEEGAGIANGNIAWATQGSSGTHLLASGQQRPHGIAVDNTYVYWTSYTSGKIYRSPKP
jgi:hypothetical protein